MIRHGDILLKKVKHIPDSKPKNNIIAYGEVTGHKHQVVNGKVMIDSKRNQYVQAGAQTELIHEEHKKVKIPVGNWAVIQQREYDIQEGVRQVMD